MQSRDTKPKRTRTAPKEPSANTSQPTQTGIEEAANIQRKSNSNKALMEPTAAAKQHRRVSKRASEPVASQEMATQGSVQSPGAQPVGAPSQELPARISQAATDTVRHQDIAALAYSYWLQRGRQHGHHEEDWFRAERALRS
jgi:hypothetical protein